MKATTIIPSVIADGDTGSARPSLLERLRGILRGLKEHAADREMRRQLADLDESLLKDIGIADDEIWRIRNKERFTPRSWA